MKAHVDVLVTTFATTFESNEPLSLESTFVNGALWQPDQSRPIVRLGIGKSALVPRDGIAGMLVGSCVGLFMFDPALRIAAAAHVSLPSASVVGADPTVALETMAGKFGDAAPQHLLDLVQRSGGNRSRIIVKMAGAACMFGSTVSIDGSPRETIGDLNAVAVRQSIESLGLTIHAVELGGNQGRKLFFDTRDGILRVMTVRGEMLEL